MKLLLVLQPTIVVAQGADPTAVSRASLRAGPAIEMQLEWRPGSLQPGAVPSVVGRFVARLEKTECRGTLRSHHPGNELLTRLPGLWLAQRLEAGRCVHNCSVVLSADFSSYQSVCRGTVVSSGPLETSGPVQELSPYLQGVAQMPPRDFDAGAPPSPGHQARRPLVPQRHQPTESFAIAGVVAGADSIDNRRALIRAGYLSEGKWGHYLRYHARGPSQERVFRIVESDHGSQSGSPVLTLGMYEDNPQLTSGQIQDWRRALQSRYGVNPEIRRNGTQAVQTFCHSPSVAVHLVEGQATVALFIAGAARGPESWGCPSSMQTPAQGVFLHEFSRHSESAQIAAAAVEAREREARRAQAELQRERELAEQAEREARRLAWFEAEVRPCFRQLRSSNRSCSTVCAAWNYQLRLCAREEYQCSGEEAVHEYVCDKPLEAETRCGLVFPKRFVKGDRTGDVDGTACVLHPRAR